MLSKREIKKCLCKWTISVSAFVLKNQLWNDYFIMLRKFARPLYISILRILHLKPQRWKSELARSLHSGSRLFRHRSARFRPCGEKRKKNSGGEGLLNTHRILHRSLSCRREVKYWKRCGWKPALLCLQRNGKETVGWTQVEDQMART